MTNRRDFIRIGAAVPLTTSLGWGALKAATLYPPIVGFEAPAEPGIYVVAGDNPVATSFVMRRLHRQIGGQFCLGTSSTYEHEHDRKPDFERLPCQKGLTVFADDFLYAADHRIRHSSCVRLMKLAELRDWRLFISTKWQKHSSVYTCRPIIASYSASSAWLIKGDKLVTQKSLDRQFHTYQL